MSLPTALTDLLDLGVIQEVLRPLQAGKEAQIFLVRSQGETRVAKVYKEATERSFKHRSDYTEGRRVRNSRQQRAMNKNTRFGRQQNEAAWRSAEVDCLYKAFEAGVRVPTPYEFVESVLIMELIGNGQGAPAPRLSDLSWSPKDAKALLEHLIQEVVRMLCAGVVHGDLSDFNILVDTEGPVIIDFPQAVDPAANRQAKRLLLRDVTNLTNFLGRFAPHLRKRRYGPEMWGLYERGELKADTVLTGRFKRSTRVADTRSVLAEIQFAAKEEAALQEARGGPSKYAARKAKRVQEEAKAIAAEKTERAQMEEKKGTATKEEERPRRRRRRRGPRTN